MSAPAEVVISTNVGALLIATIFSSILYGVTWLQVYSYYSCYCSRDRWHLKSLVAFLMAVDSVNMAFIGHANYYYSVTIWGDLTAFNDMPWSFPAVALSAIILEVSVQHFYAYRIYLLSKGSPYLPVLISVISLTGFVTGIVFGVIGLEEVYVVSKGFRALFIATGSSNILCDVLITLGMVYTLWSNHTLVRRTNTVLNLLTIYTVNCGILNLAFFVPSMILLYVYPDELIFTPTSFIMVRLYFCSFMSILNTRDNLREMLDGPDVVVASFTQLRACSPPGTSVSHGVQVTTESITDTGLPSLKSLPQVQVSSYTSFFNGVMALGGENYPPPVPPVPAESMA
ncbi:hypothetical protein EI94DRAFT_1733129 [Lactarius quietus]|nr:hypothetical protein EI94DRAFT_1733129 [Lactarius quietus]